jgi:hypothetical protein
VQQEYERQQGHDPTDAAPRRFQDQQQAEAADQEIQTRLLTRAISQRLAAGPYVSLQQRPGFGLNEEVRETDHRQYGQHHAGDAINQPVRAFAFPASEVLVGRFVLGALDPFRRRVGQKAQQHPQHHEDGQRRLRLQDVVVDGNQGEQA